MVSLNHSGVTHDAHNHHEGSEPKIGLVAAGSNLMELSGIQCEARRAGIRLLAVARTGPELREAILDHEPDVVLSEADLAQQSFMDVVSEVRPRRPKMACVLFDRSVPDCVIGQALRMRFAGILTKERASRACHVRFGRSRPRRETVFGVDRDKDCGEHRTGKSACKVQRQAVNAWRSPVGMHPASRRGKFDHFRSRRCDGSRRA